MLKGTNRSVIDELLRLKSEYAPDGCLSPELVVNEARPESSPLHHKFNWDDTAAAELYRVCQARQLIRVTIEIIDTGKHKIAVPVFVNLRSDRGKEDHGYRLQTVVIADPVLCKELLADALAELDTFRKKYENLKALSGVFREIRSVEREYKQKEGREKKAAGKRMGLGDVSVPVPVPVSVVEEVRVHVR